jgi:hypothetical protein
MACIWSGLSAELLCHAFCLSPFLSWTHAPPQTPFAALVSSLTCNNKAEIFRSRSIGHLVCTSAFFSRRRIVSSPSRFVLLHLLIGPSTRSASEASLKTPSLPSLSSFFSLGYIYPPSHTSSPSLGSIAAKQAFRQAPLSTLQPVLPAVAFPRPDTPPTNLSPVIKSIYTISATGLV